MFEDYLTAKYVDISEKELSTKRADEYHIWVKDYVRLINNIMYLIVSIIIYIMIFYIYAGSLLEQHTRVSCVGQKYCEWIRK